MNKKTLGVFAVVATTLLALTGCFRVVSEYTLNEDDTVDGSVIFAFAEEFADEDLSQLTGGGDPAADFENARVEEYNEDGFVGTKVTFTDQPLSSFPSDDSFSITREGDTYVVSGSLGTEDEFFDGADLRLIVTFPGEVTEHNGTLSGNTVTWDAAEGQFDVSAVGSAVGGGGGGANFIVMALLIVVLLLAGLGIGIFFLMRSSKKAPAEGTNEESAT